MGAIHSTSVLWRTVTREVSSKYWKGTLVTQGKWGSEEGRSRLRSKCLEMWKYVRGLGTASNALQLEHRMGLGGSIGWGWVISCEELCLPSCRFPTPVPICSDTAVVQKDWAAKNSYQNQNFHMRGVRVFQILWPVQSFQSSDDKAMRNYVFPTSSSSNWFLLSSCIGIKTERRRMWQWWWLVIETTKEIPRKSTLTRTLICIYTHSHGTHKFSTRCFLRATSL